MNESAPQAPVPRFVSLVSAGEYLACNPITVKRLVDAGKLRGYRIGRLVRVDLNEVDAMLREQVEAS